MIHDRKHRHKKMTCTFCLEKITQIDYKNVETMKKYLSEYGRISPRYLNGNCAKCQRMLAQAIKLARYMALLPYVGAVHAEE